MDDSRPLSAEPTAFLSESMAQTQEVAVGEIAIFPSLGVLQTGTVIASRYVVEGELSESGGESDVFCCWDKETGQKVAVKVYRDKFSPKQDLMQILKKLKHKNLIDLLDFDTWNNRFIEVMEFAAGGALTGGMPYDEDFLKKVIIPQVVEGMNCLHDNNIIHRDIKSANLFLRIRAKVRL